MAVTKKEELGKLKRALRYIKVARKSGHMVAHSMLNSEDFDKVIKPLEEISGWSGEDKEEVEALLETFAREAKGKTLKEKRTWLVKISKMSS